MSSADLLAEWPRWEEHYLRRIDRAAAGHADWADRLRAAALESARMARLWPRIAQIVIVEAPGLGRPGQERQLQLIERLTARVDEWRRDSPDAEEAAISSRWIPGVFFAGFYRCLAAGEPEAIEAGVPGMMFLALSPYRGVETALAELDRPPEQGGEGS